MVWDGEARRFKEIKIGGPGDGDRSAEEDAREGDVRPSTTSGSGKGGKVLWDDVRDDFMDRLDE